MYSLGDYENKLKCVFGSEVKRIDYVKLVPAKSELKVK